MKRRIATLFLIVALAAGTMLSAEATALFPPSVTYSDQFTDINPDDWFYENVAALYSLGLTNGKNSPHTFVPESDMTVAEVLTMAARLRSLQDFGSAESGAALHHGVGINWYDPYVAYLKAGGIISTEFDGQWNRSATRAEMAHILAWALPAELFSPINQAVVAEGYATGRFITDVTEYTPYQQDILTLYRWGILSGTDTTGSFRPELTIRRSEVAAMVTRLVDSDLRVTLDWKTDDEPREIFSLADLVSADESFSAAPAPDNSAEIDAALRSMLSRGERKLTLNYPTPSTEQSATAVMQAFLTAVRTYPEQTYNKVSISYSTSSGKVDLTFSSSLYDPLLIDSYREQIFSAAMQLRDSLYAAGTLSSTMSQYDKARVYFTWLCNYCSYDNNATDNSMSHSAYNVFFEKKAVCDGYTAVYNLLLKLEGIQCSAVDSEEWNHMWTIATLDGITYHIDPTWGDQTGSIAYQYFAMTEAVSLARFR